MATEQITAANLASLIASLNKNCIYDYPNTKTSTKLKIIRVTMPEGPVTFKRWDPRKDGSELGAKEESISSSALWRLAGSIKPDTPINVDRVFGGSYNTRSALETMLLNTENFFLCYPGRLQKNGVKTKVKSGHKHMVYRPEETHPRGKITEFESKDMVISEVDREVHFDSLLLPKTKEKVDIQIARRHAQMQVMLIKSAESLGLKTWVAKNDQGILYGDKKLVEMPSVIDNLSVQTVLQGFQDAVKAGELIDIIWFSEDGKKIPAIIEIEHSTGVTSGLTRMKGFKEEAPDLAHMTYIIAAPDEIRSEVFRKSSVEQFKELNIKYLAYSEIEEMYLLSKKKIKGIDNTKFFHTFLEDLTT